MLSDFLRRSSKETKWHGMYSTMHNAHLMSCGTYVHEKQEIKPFKLCFIIISSFINIRQKNAKKKKKLHHKSAMTEDVQPNLKDVYVFFFHRNGILGNFSIQFLTCRFKIFNVRMSSYDESRQFYTVFEQSVI